VSYRVGNQVWQPSVATKCGNQVWQPSVARPESWKGAVIRDSSRPSKTQGVPPDFSWLMFYSD